MAIVDKVLPCNTPFFGSRKTGYISPEYILHSATKNYILKAPNDARCVYRRKTMRFESVFICQFAKGLPVLTASLFENLIIEPQYLGLSIYIFLEVFNIMYMYTIKLPIKDIGLAF